MVLTAFFADATSQEPISLTEAITFVWLGQAMLSLLPWNIDKELEAQVKNGHVVYELIRPLDLYRVWFARSFALRLAPLILRALPIFLFSGWLFGLMAPHSLASGIAFSFSVVAALFLSTAMTTLIVISLFWTLSGEGIQRLFQPLALLLSGVTVPLPLFPDWMKPFLDLQPYRGVMDIPCRLYTGVIPPSEAIYYLGFQICWTLFFIVLGKWLMARAMRQVVIQGG